MYCKECGKMIPDDSKFCMSCGTPVVNFAVESKKNGNVNTEETKTVDKNITVHPTKLNSNVRHINNIAFIVLLIAPVISTSLVYIIAAAFFIRSTMLWWVPYLINVGACSLDILMIKRRGIDVKGITYFFILVPIYIYKRTKLLNGKKWLTTAIWSTLFVICLILPSAFWARIWGTNPSMIDIVQNGHFLKYPDVKIGELLNTTIEECKWDTYFGSHSRVLVNANGNTIYGDSIDIVFELGLNNKISIPYIKRCNSEKEKEFVIDYLYEIYRESKMISKLDKVEKTTETEDFLDNEENQAGIRLVTEKETSGDTEGNLLSIKGLDSPANDEGKKTGNNTELGLPYEIYDEIKGTYYSKSKYIVYKIISCSEIEYYSGKDTEYLTIVKYEHSGLGLLLYVDSGSVIESFTDGYGNYYLNLQGEGWNYEKSYLSATLERLSKETDIKFNEIEEIAFSTKFYALDVSIQKGTDGYYYLMPISDASILYCVDTETESRLNGLRIAKDAKIGLAESYQYDSIHHFQFNYQYYNFYDVVDTLFESGHWIIRDDLLCFQTDACEYTLYPMITMNSESEVDLILESYSSDFNEINGAGFITKYDER